MYTQPSKSHPKPRISTGPDPHHAILPPLGQIPVPNPHSLHAALAVRVPAVPVPAVGLVVDFRHALAYGGHDAAGVEHHACDGAVVGVGVVDGAGAEVPDLGEVAC